MAIEEQPKPATFHGGPMSCLYYCGMSRSRVLVYVALLLATVLLAYAAGFGTYWVLSQHGLISAPATAGHYAPDNEKSASFGLLREAWDILESAFYGEQPPAKQRTYGAIKGLVQEYGDPYTYFIEPQPRQREREELSGEFGGIGAWVYQDEDGAIRLDPMPERPAERAGVQRGDIVRAIDGHPVTPGTTTDDVVDLIRGPVGEPVVLTLYRESNAQELTLTIIRERIEMPSVEWRALEQDSRIGYVAIHLFGEHTAHELDRAIDELAAQNIAYLILDLRHNTGGLLQAAVDVTSRFLHDGVVLYERKSDGSEVVYRVASAARAPEWPMAVLVDAATASASEIVAGALQDRGRAILIGEQTFGKGSVQMVYDLSDGSSIHVTVAKWLTPNGHEIDGKGLTPDIEVMAAEGRDAALEEAVRYLSATGAMPQAPLWRSYKSTDTC